MWLASVFALVFLGFASTTGIATTGVTWAAYRGSWRQAAIVVAAAAGLAAVLGLTVAARVTFAGTYLPQVASFWVFTVLIAGGIGAILIRFRAPGEPMRGVTIGVVIACLLWIGLTLVLGGISACNLDAGCY